jgi:hypothetical protein
LRTEKIEVIMKCFKVLLGTVLFLGLVALLSPGVKADEHDKSTIVTFDQAVEVPGGVVLPAGTYLFRLLDSQSDRNIVQIFNREGTHIFATILAINNYRLHVKDKTVMTFGERAVGMPEAIRAWFYPGDNYGQEFVYPRTRALELAKVTNMPVLVMPSELVPDITAPVKSIDEEPAVALRHAPVSAVQPTGEDVEMAEVVQPADQTASATMPSRLPQTASNLPLVALFGLLSLGAGLGFSLFGKRIG